MRGRERAQGRRDVDTSSTTKSSFSLREPVAFLFKRSRQIAWVFAVTAFFSTVGAYIGPREYLASSTIYIERHVPPIAEGSGRSFFMILDRKEVLNSEVDFITSRTVAEKVADELLAARGPGRERKRPLVGRMARAVSGAIRSAMLALGLADAGADERESLISFIRSSIEAKPALQSNLITISMKGTNPEQAADIVNAVTRAYLRERLTLMKRPGLDEFYDEHLARTRSTLEDLEARARQLKEAAGIVSVDEQIRLKLQELSDNNTNLTQARSQINELKERIGSLRKQLTGLPENVTVSKLVQRNPMVVDLERKKVDLEAKKATEITHFSPDSQPIRDLEQSIAQIDLAIAAEPATIMDSESVASNGVYIGLQSELYRAESDLTAKLAGEATLVDHLKTLEGGLATLNDKADELHRLSASVASAERIYYGYVEKREEVTIEDSTDPGTTNVRVVYEASVPQRPIYPRAVLISIGAGMGLLLGLGLAFVSEFFDHSLCTREDIERHLGLPLLASLPAAKSVAQPLSGAGAGPIDE
jgi:uncharacterized protein involved in exopolysaccharide biosynthesis